MNSSHQYFLTRVQSIIAKIENAEGEYQSFSASQRQACLDYCLYLKKKAEQPVDLDEVALTGLGVKD